MITDLAVGQDRRAAGTDQPVGRTPPATTASTLHLGTILPDSDIHGVETLWQPV